MTLIDKDKLIYDIELAPLTGDGGVDINDLEDIVKRQPTIEERKTGEWLYGEDDAGQDGWTCSECGFFVPWYYDYYGLNNIDFIRDFHTCPHCDARMLTYTGAKMGVEHE